MNPITSRVLRVACTIAAPAVLASAAVAFAVDAPAGPASASGPDKPISITTRMPVDQLPVVPELPDPFKFVDGSRVGSKDDWARRRAELKELIQTYEYGHLPPMPPAGSVSVKPAPDYQPPKRSGSNADTAPVADEGVPANARREKYLVTVAAPGGKTVEFHMMLTLPQGNGPFPVVVRGDMCWGKVRPQIAQEVANRGYALADFDRNEIVPDKKGERNVGAYTVYPDGDFSAVAAWAWGYHRVIDYLVTRPDIAKDKIIVTGHSRGGKTALLAGLMDDRVALTNPNNSGCGGAGCYRYQAPKSEAIENITKNFPYWFQPQFTDFIGKVDRLPIDQHSVKAAIAPRALLTTEALGDLWANPEGTQVSHAAAAEVYAWLGAADKLAVHYREGKHEQNLEDWKVLLNVADRLWAGKPLAEGLNSKPFPNAPKPWTWTAPK
jgi:hypothetical protein